MNCHSNIALEIPRIIQPSKQDRYFFELRLLSAFVVPLCFLLTGTEAFLEPVVRGW